MQSDAFAHHTKRGLLVCDALTCLHLVRKGSLRLTEGDWVRLLTAAVVPLELMVPQLQRFAADVSLAPSPTSPTSMLVDACVHNCSVATLLLTRIAVTPPPAVPERAAALLMATALKPPKLVAWVSAVCQAALASMHAAAEALRNLFCANACLGLSAEVESRPDLQRQLVQFGARCLVLPEAEQAASVEDDEWCRILAQVAEVLSSVCLRDARIQYETASIGSGNSLLKATGSLAARLHLRSASASFEQAKFVLAFLTLMGSLCSDAVSLAEEGQPVSAQHIAVLVQQALQLPGGIPQHGHTDGHGTTLSALNGPVTMLARVAELQPAVLPRLAAQGVLVRALCTAGATLAQMAGEVPQAGMLYQALCDLLRKLVLHLQAEPTQQADVQQCVEGLSSDDGQCHRRALQLCTSLIEQRQEVDAASSSSLPRRQPLSPEEKQLSERRALALALLKLLRAPPPDE
ncbi:hypothetical protein CHLNCDRAFT_139493 [Chlorella variabilis]|uniref:Uncharacterized protein n=1 Tax=Chlorella variabilis TaxID=554065 RepID=E1ZQ99_CHLVA|nr:hypothetical protein CHLNCDRAFT_139493 [Chlorella variabilis]EFN51986.1 hypothetical protein CHLNCDRAFT_139493 [Chlorella variabilis]|eukprot:XP_005844088.1 hypothetical protein CHLNCDRAFT_139493 [Chlorella variabilis]